MMQNLKESKEVHLFIIKNKIGKLRYLKIWKILKKNIKVKEGPDSKWKPKPQGYIQMKFKNW